MVFRRGIFPLSGLGGALPTQAHLGKLIRLEDENTVSSNAIGGNDLSVKLVAIDDDGYWVEF
jgi:hypothetical protein